MPTDRPARVALIMAEQEYRTHETLPMFAARQLHAPLGMEIAEVAADPIDAQRLGGFVEALQWADTLILSVRRRALSAEAMAALNKYLSAGRPIVGIRTANHAFAPHGDVADGFSQWRSFDAQVIGGNYQGHHGAGPAVQVTAAEGAADHRLIAGLTLPARSHGSLYRVSPLADAAVPLLVGRIPDKPAEPVAWTHRFGASRIFYTSMGHPEDFAEPMFVELLTRAVRWSLDRG